MKLLATRGGLGGYVATTLMANGLTVHLACRTAHNDEIEYLYVNLKI